jgi:hypothetical protein
MRRRTTMRLRKIFPTPALLVLGFPLIWACEDSVTEQQEGLRDTRTRMVLQPRLTELAVGEALQLGVHFTGQLPPEVDGRDDGVWVSSNTSVADVDRGGTVFALSPGEAIIDLYRGPFHAWARVIVAGERSGNDPPLDPHDVRHGAH